MKKLMVIFATMAIGASGCGPSAASNNGGNGGNGDNGDNGGPSAEEQLAQACAAQPAAGDFCDSFSDCPDTSCYCTDGSIVTTTSCVNGICQGRDACDSTCAERGTENACVEEVSSSNNSTSNNSSQNGSTNGMTSGPTCDADLSTFADWEFSYDVACLEQNCCAQAAACAINAACRAYDDCLFGCFSGGVTDDACIRRCKEENTTDEFLDNTYGPFSVCAVNNRC